MTLKIDLHVHTVASGHAYNTIYELVQEAKRKKMKVIGISDHGPGLDGTLTDLYYFQTLTRLPIYIDGIRVLRGVELNPNIEKEDIDLPEKVLSRLDFAMIFYHPNFGDKLFSIEKNTDILIKIIKKYPKIKIISHPYIHKGVDIDLKKLSEYACQNDLLLELNLSTLNNSHYPMTDFKKIKEMISIVKSYNKKIFLGSDAHFMDALGNDSVLTPELMKEIGLTKEMIINNYPDELEKILGVKF